MKMIKCTNPKHDDKIPSMSVRPDGSKFCHACGHSESAKD